MFVNTPEYSCFHFNFKAIARSTNSLQKNNFNSPLSIYQNEKLYIFFSTIYEYVKFALPPEIFQFYKLISEDNSQLTFNNIKEYQVVPFLIQLLSMSTKEIVMEACLSVICMFIKCSNYLLKEFILNDFLDVLPHIYSYPSLNVQTLISKIYAIVTDIDNDFDDDFETDIGSSAVHIALKCTSDFLKHSVYWAADHSEDCRKNCLIFQYNIIVGSNQNLPEDIIFSLSRFLLSILVCGNFSLVYYAAWAISRLIQCYSLSLDLKDVFYCLFSTVEDQSILDSEASIPVLRMTVKSLRNTEKFPSADELLPIINWPILFQKMISRDNEISYLSCRVCQYLIHLGIKCIDVVLSNNILGIVCLIFEDASFKSKCEVSYLLKNIWENGSIEQQKAVLCHRCFLLFLKFAEGSEMTGIEQCFLAMYVALKSITDVDQSFGPIFIKSVPSYFFAELLDNTNDDISNYSKIIFDAFYAQAAPDS